MFSLIRTSENITTFNEILNKANMAKTLIYNLRISVDRISFFVKNNDIFALRPVIGGKLLIKLINMLEKKVDENVYDYL